MRSYSWRDRLLTELDTALKVISLPAYPARARPDTEEVAADAADPVDPADRRHAACLMRVNHAGEVSAQALYRGQALMARDEGLRRELLKAAGEEHDHLAWCETRVKELGAGVSRLTPAWYAGSFVLGMLAGAAGDTRSLSFLMETERQVTAHLDGHLQQLPPEDRRSRSIVQRMRDEEQAHGISARNRGAAELPGPVRRAMGLASRVLTTLAYRY